MNKQPFFIELNDIHFKYERLASMISILQTIVSECAEIRGVPDDSIGNALYEIELEMNKTNERLSDLWNVMRGGAEC